MRTISIDKKYGHLKSHVSQIRVAESKISSLFIASCCWLTCTLRFIAVEDTVANLSWEFFCSCPYEHSPQQSPPDLPRMWVNLKFCLNYSSNGMTVLSHVYQNPWPVSFLYIWSKRDNIQEGWERISHKLFLISRFLTFSDWATGRRWLLTCLCTNSCSLPLKSSKRAKENINI